MRYTHDGIETVPVVSDWADEKARTLITPPADGGDTIYRIAQALREAKEAGKNEAASDLSKAFMMRGEYGEPK